MEQQLSLPDQIRLQTTRSTVEAIKKYMSATEEKRRKRGKYYRYTDELREKIAQYALDYSIPTASTYWSSKLNCTVSESSVRNFVKVYRNFSNETKEEIGKFAFNHGVERAALHFTEKLGFEVRKGIVIKFKKMYMKHFYDDAAAVSAAVAISAPKGADVDKLAANKESVSNDTEESKKECGNVSPQQESTTADNDTSPQNCGTRQKRVFSAQMKEEIGRYASIHGIAATMKHFTAKLRFSVKNSTVRKFRKQFMEGINKTINDQNLTDSSCSIDAPGGASVDDTDGSCAVAERQVGVSIPHPTPHNSSMLSEHQSAIQGQEQQQENMDVLHPLSVINGANVNSMNNNFVYHHHPYSINMAPAPPNPNNPLSFHQGGVLNQDGIINHAVPYQQQVIMNQAFSPQQSFHQSYSFSPSNLGHPQGGHPHGVQSMSLSHASSMDHNNMQLTMGHMQQHPSSQQQEHGNVPPHLINSSYSYDSSPNVSMNEPLSLMKHGKYIPSSETLNESLSNISSVHDNSGPPAGPSSGIIHIPIIEHSQPAQHLSQQQHSMSAEHAQSTLENMNQGNMSVQETNMNDAEVIRGNSSGIRMKTVGNENEGTTEQAVPACKELVIAEEEYEDEFEEEMNEDDLDCVPHSVHKKRKRKSTRNKKKAKSRGKATSNSYNYGKRGNYASYSPEIRAEIGKIASLHGNLAAIEHFKKKLNIEIPESTIRGLKEKFINKKLAGEKEVKSLGFAQRGRPMRLGKYDALVQECIEALSKEGEKLSSFLVITTAKQVLHQYEPSLLEENGGHIKLTPTWAKSFLKRMGLTQSS